jgi:hypothetical protein
VKGNTLTRPGNANNRRNRYFVEKVLEHINDHEGRFFCITTRKGWKNPQRPEALYAMSLQYLIERYNCYLDENEESEVGIVTLDARIWNQNARLGESTLSYLFGNPEGKLNKMITEGPVYMSSEMSVGIQLCDILGSCAYGIGYTRHCSSIPGALNYHHTLGWAKDINALEFRSRRKYEGFQKRGYKFIDHYEEAEGEEGEQEKTPCS